MFLQRVKFRFFVPGQTILISERYLYPHAELTSPFSALFLLVEGCIFPSSTLTGRLQLHF
jgi:hypothetical protein